MKLYAVETTDRMQLCRINARNITIYKDLLEAKSYAVALAINNKTGSLQEDITFDEFLDGTMAAYDKTEGDAEVADALAYITKIST